VIAASDISGVYAIMPTPALEGADRWDATESVDLTETARLTEQLIADGVSGLIVLGTTGECATLTEDEYRQFVDCFLSTVGGRVPTFVGTTCMGTHDTVRRIRFADRLGATGTLLGLPMWQPCTDDMAVEFYQTIGEAFPDVAIMAYANPQAFRYPFAPRFWAEIAVRAPTVVTAKVADAGIYLHCLNASRGRIRFMPIDMEAYAFARLDPEATTACWATAASMGPAPSLALMDAITRRQWRRAKKISDEILQACMTFMPPGGPTEFASYNVQLEKLRFEAAGYCKPGPIRPPYNVIPDSYVEGAREAGRRWAKLAHKYSGGARPSDGTTTPDLASG
jgi:trans-o-hydroxybenzylidenepyruvate hydratase-aldolase